MDCSTPGFPVLHQLPEFTQTHVRLVGVLQPHVPGNKLTQNDNADSGVQFITPAGPRENLLLAKDPDPVCENLIYPKRRCPNPPPQIP